MLDHKHRPMRDVKSAGHPEQILHRPFQFFVLASGGMFSRARGELAGERTPGDQQ